MEVAGIAASVTDLVQSTIAWLDRLNVRGSPRLSLELRTQVIATLAILETLNHSTSIAHHVTDSAAVLSSLKALQNTFQEMLDRVTAIRTTCEPQFTTTIWPFNLKENERLLSEIERCRQALDLVQVTTAARPFVARYSLP